jgi:Na+/H+ antiporter NhaD/arsenite permease-like protein
VTSPPPVETPPMAFGVSSFVLGMIGFMLFFLPILGVPISLVGLLAGVIGCFVAGATSRGSLRWSVAGVVLSCLALGINVGIAYAPRGYPQPPTRLPNQTVPDRPYVSPPAKG